MLQIQDSLNSFLSAFFGFLNDLLNGLFQFLAALFGGIDINFPQI